MYIRHSQLKNEGPGPASPEDGLWAHETGSLLDTVISLPAEQCGPAFEALSKRGITFEDTGYMVVLVCTDSVFLPSAAEHWELAFLVDESLEHIERRHMFSARGRLYVLLCFPEAGEASFDRDAVIGRVGQSMAEVLETPVARATGARIIVSSLYFGREMISECAFEVENRSDFHSFLENPPRLKVFREDYSILGDFAQTLDFYRQLSNRMVVLIRSENFSPKEAARELITGLTRACDGNIVPVYTHTHMLSLLMTEALVRAGVGEARFVRELLKKKQMLTGTSEREVRTLYEEFFTELKEHYLEKSRNAVAERMEAVREYVEENITAYDLSVTSIADSFGINRSQLTSQFRRCYGVNLSQYIQNRRVETAKALMAAHPDWSMEQVAEAAGYTSLSTMYRAFKKYDGVSPGSLRG
jgi:AraC-like DNA-binding protein